MKEIGEKLKAARESIGVSVEEVAEDLKLRASQIENMEAGNSDAFKDIVNLKYLIRDYSKYLGLNKEDLVDEFNEYLFDYTSRISLEDIKSAKKDTSKSRKIKSPYTMIEKNKKFPIVILLYIAIIALIILLVYLFININTRDDKFIEGSVITDK